jgi:AbiV family abortive infection protein
MQRITPEQIQQGRLKVLENAKSLLGEAEILARAEKHARAYTLAHLATEELAKIPMLARVGIELFIGEKVDFKKLAKRFRSHESTSGNAILFDYIHAELPDTPEAASGVERLVSIKALNDRKNASLYVSYGENGFTTPEEAISPEEARTAIARGNRLLATFDMTEAVTRDLSRLDVESFRSRLDELRSVEANAADPEAFALTMVVMRLGFSALKERLQAIIETRNAKTSREASDV